jgi:hypothetical protein
MSRPEPLNLASAEEEFLIDPSLNDVGHLHQHSQDHEDDELFLPAYPQEGDHEHDSRAEEDAVTAIKNSLSRSQAHEAYSTTLDDIAGPSTHLGDTDLENDASRPLGSESNPRINPEPHIAPHSRSVRDVNTHAHPEWLVFPDRAAFEGWFAGESSWCHYVQRRTTTPQKRAEERIKGRIKAYEQSLQSTFSIL